MGSHERGGLIAESVVNRCGESLRKLSYYWSAARGVVVNNHFRSNYSCELNQTLNNQILWQCGHIVVLHRYSDTVHLDEHLLILMNIATTLVGVLQQSNLPVGGNCSGVVGRAWSPSRNCCFIVQWETLLLWHGVFGHWTWVRSCQNSRC